MSIYTCIYIYIYIFQLIIYEPSASTPVTKLYEQDFVVACKSVDFDA
jgi:hypothetical protein